METRNRAPTHPGAVLKNSVLPALEVSRAQAARDLGISRTQLYSILDGKKPVTPNMAVRIGKFCGNGPGVWLRMQVAYDLWHAEQELAPIVAEIPTHQAA
jgi:addiction module HigA family antidote